MSEEFQNENNVAVVLQQINEKAQKIKDENARINEQMRIIGKILGSGKYCQLCGSQEQDHTNQNLMESDADLHRRYSIGYVPSINAYIRNRELTHFTVEGEEYTVVVDNGYLRVHSEEKQCDFDNLTRKERSALLHSGAITSALGTLLHILEAIDEHNQEDQAVLRDIVKDMLHRH